MEMMTALFFGTIDPFIGTAATGHTYPSATIPFGKVQPGPDFGVGGWGHCSGYVRSGGYGILRCRGAA